MSTARDKTSSKKRRSLGKRRRGREMAVQMLYQEELADSDLEEIFARFDVADYLVETERPNDEEPVEEHHDRARREARGSRARASFEYARKLVGGVLANRAEIDDHIRHHAENWRLERMSAIDRNILRLAIYEMLYESGVPKVVIVDEAIELAKKFGTESSGRFVNGLLDGVLKASRGEAAAASPSSSPGGPA